MRLANLAVETALCQMDVDSLTRYDVIGRAQNMSIRISRDSITAFKRL